MFERATKLGLRWASPIGQLNVEDLWSLPMITSRPNQASLDNVAREASKAINQQPTSFVEDDAKVDELASLRFEIVKHIIAVRKTEAKTRAEIAAKAARDARILQLIHEKQDQALSSKSIEELEALLKG